MTDLERLEYIRKTYPRFAKTHAYARDFVLCLKFIDRYKNALEEIVQPTTDKGFKNKIDQRIAREALEFQTDDTRKD